MTTAILGAVLCGGFSRRMGTNKALLEMRPGVRQLDYVVDLLRRVCGEVVVSVGPRDRHPVLPLSGVRPIYDVDDAQGPMAGIIAALVDARGRAVLAVACDMPWLEAPMLERLIGGRNSAKMATAFVAADGKPEPMCAIYEPGCAVALEQLARQGRAGLRRFMDGAEVELLELDNPELLASVNDSSQLHEARSRLTSDAQAARD
jgi:molybdopterin-guanine dinucleotide biosynthesis protein A